MPLINSIDPWSSSIISISLYNSIFIISIIITLSILIVFIKFYCFGYNKLLIKSCLYSGRVKHVRLKGGAIHTIDYPIFLSCMDLNEMESIGMNLWPIFHVSTYQQRWIDNIFSFSCFDYKEHLKEWKNKSNFTLKQNLFDFIREKSNNSLNLNDTMTSVRLISHLSYFGYCFNPVSFYYLYDNDISTKEVLCNVVEVSNTPWIEQHCYLLHETISDVEIRRNKSDFSFEAIWKKAFHVSPFMEMDYKYHFSFSSLESEKKTSIWVSKS